MKQTGKLWKDANGHEIPVEYIKSYEKNDEKAAQRIFSKIATVYKHLEELKALVTKEMENSIKIRQEETGLLTKSHTIYSFDKTFKITQNYLDTVQFDEGLIAAAYDSFNKFFEDNLSDKQKAIKKLIMSAFEKRGGKLDPKAILQLNKFRGEITDEHFQKALDYIDQASSTVPSKLYTQFHTKDAEGEYASIILNFNSI